MILDVVYHLPFQGECENIDQLLDGCQLINISSEPGNGEIHIHTTFIIIGV